MADRPCIEEMKAAAHLQKMEDIAQERMLWVDNLSREVNSLRAALEEIREEAAKDTSLSWFEDRARQALGTDR